MKMNRFMLIAAAVLLCALLAACGKSGGTGSAKTSDGLSVVKVFAGNKYYTVEGERLQLSDWVEGKVPSKLWDQFVADLAKHGVRLDLDLIMPDQMATSFQTLLASGKLNDYDWVTTGGSLSEPNALALINQRRAYPMNKAIEEFSQGSAKNYIAQNPAGQFIKKVFTVADGNFYWLVNTQATYYQDPSYSVGSHVSGMIRMDWLNTLGLKIPTSLDEFYNALVAFQQNDMNKNGVKDERAQIPLDEFNNGVAQWFGLGWELFSLIDYKIVSPWYQPSIKDYFTYMNKLYKAGLIHVDSEGGAMEANRIGYVNEWIMETWYEPGIIVPSGAAKPEFAPFAFQAVQGIPGRVYLQSGNTKDMGIHFIPTGAKNKEGAVKMIDYLYSPEYSSLTEIGIEGYNYTLDADGKVQILRSGAANIGKDFALRAAQLPCLWANNSVLPRRRATDMEAEVISVANQGFTYKHDFAAALYNKEYDFVQERGSYQAFPTPEETARISQLSPDLTTYSKELSTSLITGEKSLANWDSYMADLKRLGLDELITIYQARINRVVQ